jgi:hypothetical protein
MDTSNTRGTGAWVVEPTPSTSQNSMSSTLESDTFAMANVNAVNRDQITTTNNFFSSPNPSQPIGYPTPRRTAAAQEELSESASDVYARLLLTKKIGYPLWMPEPNSNPEEYAAEGANIGDVGEITYDGAFNFLFNICLPLDHPINSRAPPTLEPIIINRNRDVNARKLSHRGFVIASQTVEQHGG